MLIPELPRKTFFEDLVFRNIATIKVSQDLFDDVIGNIEDISTLQCLADETSGIDHSNDPKNRSFQYCDPSNSLAVFEEGHWYVTRFSNGTFGVWYGALEKETSITEALFWNYRNVYKPMLSKTKRPINVDRRMLEAKSKTNAAADLRKSTLKVDELTHDSNYSFCQALGGLAVKEKIDLYLTPSARKSGGTCVPIFTPSAIIETKTLFYIHFEFRTNGSVRVTSDQDEVLPIPESW